MGVVLVPFGGRLGWPVRRARYPNAELAPASVVRDRSAASDGGGGRGRSRMRERIFRGVAEQVLDRWLFRS
jgi:hypothetical protein